MIRMLAIGLIKLYQYLISPFKGYKCAHDALHGKGGCASRVASHIKSKPVGEWYAAYKAEVSSCKDAYAVLKEKKKRKNKKESDEDNCKTEHACEVLNCGASTNKCDIGDCTIGSCDFL